MNTHERFERGLSCQLLRPELKWASRARPVSRLDHKAKMPEAGSAHFKCRAGPILFTPCAIHSIHSCSFLRLGGTPVLQMLGTPQCVVRLDGCKCTHVPVHNGIWFGRLGGQTAGRICARSFLQIRTYTLQKGNSLVASRDDLSAKVLRLMTVSSGASSSKPHNGIRPCCARLAKRAVLLQRSPLCRKTLRPPDALHC